MLYFIPFQIVKYDFKMSLRCGDSSKNGTLELRIKKSKQFSVICNPQQFIEELQDSDERAGISMLPHASVHIPASFTHHQHTQFLAPSPTFCLTCNHELFYMLIQLYFT